MTDSRQEILNILMRVQRDGSYASLLIRSADIDEKDIGFVTETVYGTIRNYALLEYQWHRFAKKTDLRTALLLDMTLYQMHFMESVPAYAAVHEAVAMADKNKRGFVNAVLRSIQRERWKEPEELSVRLSHPEWILKMWSAHYGADTAEAIAMHDQQPSAVCGRMNTLLADRQQLMEEGFSFLAHDCVVCGQPIQRTDAFRSGKVIIQGRSSQEVVRFLQAEPGMKVLDLCAAPGTKTQQIACAMENRGEITACDIYEQRTKLISDLMAKTGVSICQTKVNDASKPGAFAEKSFDRILMDVPCSGLGDLSHKPEIRWHLQPQDIDALVSLQKQILDAGCAYVRENGILVYSTCTLNRKENEAQIMSFLQRHPEFEKEEERTIFPQDLDSDGFYVCRLRRKPL